MVKCYTKKKSDGGSYTTCIGFQAKSGKTKPKAKPKSKLKGKTITIKRKIKKKKKVKGVMTIQKKIKGTKKLENKSTIKPVISKSKAKPKPKAKAPKKLSAGKSVLLTQGGFMAMVGKASIPKKRKKLQIEADNIVKNMKERNLNKYQALFKSWKVAKREYLKYLKKNKPSAIKGEREILNKELKKINKTLKKVEKIRRMANADRSQEHYDDNIRKYGADWTKYDRFIARDRHSWEDDWVDLWA